MSAKNPTRSERAARLAEMQRDLITAMEELRDEIQEGRDNMPESFQDGAPGQKADARISSLEDAISSAESAADSLEEFDNA